MTAQMPVPDHETAAPLASVPPDLIALELHRHRVKADTGPTSCGCLLYRAAKAVTVHPWIAAHTTNRRTARKALALAPTRRYWPGPMACVRPEPRRKYRVRRQSRLVGTALNTEPGPERVRAFGIVRTPVRRAVPKEASPC